MRFILLALVFLPTYSEELSWQESIFILCGCWLLLYSLGDAVVSTFSAANSINNHRLINRCEAALVQKSDNHHSILQPVPEQGNCGLVTLRRSGPWFELMEQVDNEFYLIEVAKDINRDREELEQDEIDKASKNVTMPVNARDVIARVKLVDENGNGRNSKATIIKISENAVGKIIRERGSVSRSALVYPVSLTTIVE